MINRHSIGMRKQRRRHKRLCRYECKWTASPSRSTFKIHRATVPPCGGDVELHLFKLLGALPELSLIVGGFKEKAF